MKHVETEHDFGTGEKKLNIYISGMVACVLLTLLSFGSVMLNVFSNTQVMIIIFLSAIIQFFVQVLFFLRLNTETAQGRINVMVFLFTGIILFCILFGSLWIMWNLNYNMGH